MKKRILVLCGTDRDMRELSRPQIKKNFDIVYEESSTKWLATLCELSSIKDVSYHVESAIDQIGNFAINNDIDAIVSSKDYPANVLRVAINEKLKKVGPRLYDVLKCEHKYYARLIQQESVPEAVPSFALVKNGLVENVDFPLIVKPVKSNFGKNAFVIDTIDNFAKIIKIAPLPIPFLAPFNYLFKKHCTEEHDAYSILAEKFITGYQTTVEGFVRNGKVTILGVVDALMFPDSISFLRFEYPSCLDQEIQNKMISITERAIEGIGLDNTVFNVECIYNLEMNAVYIIEINPRISSQFSDLFERVDGFNTYQTMIELALNREPEIKKGKGKFNIAASCVLRFFEDKFVERVPSRKNIEKVQELFPDMHLEIYAQPGKMLSEEQQDSKSYRYGLIGLGAYDREDLLNRFEICKQLLDFRFKNLR